jgi:hypothetical protein
VLTPADIHSRLGCGNGWSYKLAENFPSALGLEHWLCYAKASEMLACDFEKTYNS